MTYLGIDRGDGRTPEQKVAAENIEIGVSAAGGMCSFYCLECRESEWMPGEIRHRPGCKTGEILEGKCAK